MTVLRRHCLVIFLILSMGVLCAAGPAVAASDVDEAQRFIRDGIARTIELLKRKQMPRAEIAKRLREELSAGFDVAAIAAYALGPLARQITRDQQRRYVRAFEELIVQTYTNRVFNVQPRITTISPDIIRVIGTTRISAHELLVHSRVNRTGANWINIDWRLREREQGLRIVDIIIIGISQAQVYRSEFASVLRRRGGGIEGLIEALTRKNEELRAD